MLIVQADKQRTQHSSFHGDVRPMHGTNSNENRFGGKEPAVAPSDLASFRDMYCSDFMLSGVTGNVHCPGACSHLKIRPAVRQAVGPLCCISSIVS